MHIGDVLKYTDITFTPRKTRCDISKVETTSADKAKRISRNTGSKKGKSKRSTYTTISAKATNMENK